MANPTLLQVNIGRMVALTDLTTDQPLPQQPQHQQLYLLEDALPIDDPIKVGEFISFRTAETKEVVAVDEKREGRCHHRITLRSCSPEMLAYLDRHAMVIEYDRLFIPRQFALRWSGDDQARCQQNHRDGRSYRFFDEKTFFPGEIGFLQSISRFIESALASPSPAAIADLIYVVIPSIHYSLHHSDGSSGDYNKEDTNDFGDDLPYFYTPSTLFDYINDMKMTSCCYPNFSIRIWWTNDKLKRHGTR